jgi:predicted nuclease of restriction endonuclease-like RecB superfamily
MRCSRCAGLFSSGRAKERMIPAGSLTFCSVACLFCHIKEQSALSARELASLKIREANNDSSGRDCYSPILGMSFRSWLECSIAEYVAQYLDAPIYYESHAVLLPIGRVYIPDFWIPSHGVWLEAKGEWRLGARGKFVEAMKILSPERLLLILPFHQSEMKKKGKVWNLAKSAL